MNDFYPHAAQEPARGLFDFEEKVQFTDGETALLYRQPEDYLVLGHTSLHKYARDFYGMHMARIQTSSGNHYGIANGYVIDQRLQVPMPLPGRNENIGITIGKGLHLTSFVSSSVMSVMLRYAREQPNSPDAIQTDESNPFIQLDEQTRGLPRY